MEGQCSVDSRFPRRRRCVGGQVPVRALASNRARTGTTPAGTLRQGPTSTSQRRLPRPATVASRIRWKSPDGVSSSASVGSGVRASVALWPTCAPSSSRRESHLPPGTAFIRAAGAVVTSCVCGPDALVALLVGRTRGLGAPRRLSASAHALQARHHRWDVVGQDKQLRWRRTTSRAAGPRLHPQWLGCAASLSARRSRRRPGRAQVGRTVQAWRAGDGSVLPARSVARTRNVCGPVPRPV
jgi:hypothetical protein